MKKENYIRYNRQIILNEFGMEGQEKLSKAKVLIIGAGGLGCPAMIYLNAAGVGTIGIVDFDTVFISNLHRQILYGDDDIGKSKVIVAEQKLKALNPNTVINSIDLKLDNSNAISIISVYDLVLDCSDNFSTRYLVNDACVLMNKPLVYGSIFKFEGHVGVFNYEPLNNKRAVNYRDLFTVSPDQYEIPNCDEIGVIGVVPGIIGTMMANETIKVITGIGNVLANRIISFNSLNNSFLEFEISLNENALKNAPKSFEELINYDYELLCNNSSVELMS